MRLVEISIDRHPLRVDLEDIVRFSQIVADEFWLKIRGNQHIETKSIKKISLYLDDQPRDAHNALGVYVYYAKPTIVLSGEGAASKGKVLAKLGCIIRGVADSEGIDVERIVAAERRINTDAAVYVDKWFLPVKHIRKSAGELRVITRVEVAKATLIAELSLKDKRLYYFLDIVGSALDNWWSKLGSFYWLSPEEFSLRDRDGVEVARRLVLCGAESINDVLSRAVQKR